VRPPKIIRTPESPEPPPAPPSGEAEVDDAPVSCREQGTQQSARLFTESLSRVSRARGASGLAAALGVSQTLVYAWGNAESGKRFSVADLLAGAEREPAWAQAFVDKLAGAVDAIVHRRPSLPPRPLDDDTVDLLKHLGAYGQEAHVSDADSHLTETEYRTLKVRIGDLQAAARRAEDNLDRRYALSAANPKPAPRGAR
jgi:hypothetical protein